MTSRVPATTPAPTLYRLGPLERRGLFGRVRRSQVAVLLATTSVAVGCLLATPSAVGLLAGMAALCAGGAAAFWPLYQERTLDELAPVMAGFLARRASGRHVYRSGLAEAGVCVIGPDPACTVAPPREVGQVELFAAPYGRGDLGVAADREAGTFIGVVECRAESFALLDQADKEARLAGYAEVVKALARDSAPVRRLQLMEMTVPGDSQALHHHLDQHADPATPSGIRASYLELIRCVGPVTAEHRVYVAVVLEPGRAGRAIRQYRRQYEAPPVGQPGGRLGGRPSGRGSDLDQGAAAVLAREVRGVIRRLERADIKVQQVLSIRALAALFALAYDPNRRRQVARRVRVAEAFHGVHPRSVWPDQTGPEQPTCYPHQDVVSATYWVGEYPREPVHAEFLAPLLVHSGITRTISLVVEGVPAAKAMRQATFAKTSDQADADLRAKLGFLATARHEQQREAVARREQELAAGHVDVRFATWITVTAPDADALEAACEELEDLAAQCRLEVRLATCEQARAFTFGALPLGRGLRRARILG